MRGLPTWSKRRYAAVWRDRAGIVTPGEITYVALGDSAAQGIGATSPDLGYVGLLAAVAARHTGLPVRVINLSVSGATAADVLAGQVPLLADITSEIATGLAATVTTPDLVTCAVGGNDIRRFEPVAFAEAVGALIRSLPQHALIADVPCFYDGRGEARSTAASEIISRQADVASLTLVRLHAATHARTRAQVRGDFALDFFHPNDRGYRVWAEAFDPAVLARLDAVMAARGSG
ncbi:MAG: SGNH/GDSL hydrolase family protein [Burkholderiaceae bacterium]|nr:SGNH/GDSL hydrolase family protein [Microbacteriaceae bacterium]